MLCINLESTDPFFNLAVDEYLLKNNKEDFLILGINGPSVIVGKHQVVHREVNAKAVTEHKIPVIRRISGGGTVFHDMGNLNFSFIKNSEQGKQVDFRKYTRPVIEFLSYMGIEANFEGKNDLKVNGLKISGNSEHVYHNRVLHHGTLLFNADLEILREVIKRDPSGYETRAVGSNPAPVTNLLNVLKYAGKTHDFKSLMMKWFLSNTPGSEPFVLSESDKLAIGELAVSKYRTWEWNYAYGPEYYFISRLVFGGKEHSCRMFVKEGVIRECEIKGSEDLKPAVKKLTGCRHMVKDILGVLEELELIEKGLDIYNLF